MKNNYKTIVLGIFLITISFFVRSAAIEGSCYFEEYQCEVGKAKINICNNTQYSQDYLLYSEGNYKQWLNVIPANFSLAKNSCKEVTIFMSSDCYANPGQYESKIVIKEGSTTQTLNCNILIKQGHMVEVNVVPEEQTATQCESKYYNIKLTNLTKINQQSEPLRLVVKGLPEDWYNIEKKNIYVLKGIEENVRLTLAPPCNAALGNYDFRVEAISQFNENFVYSDSAKFLLTQGQEIVIEGANSYDLCREEDNKVILRVINKGKLADNIKFKIEGPSWVSLDKTSMLIDKNSSGEIALLIPKNQNLETKEYKVKIIAESQYNYSNYKELNLNLIDCYSLDLLKKQGQYSFCLEDEKEHVFEVKNTGIRPTEVSILVVGIDYAINNEKISLGPNESKEIQIKFNVNQINNVVENKKFKVIATSLYDKIEKEYDFNVENCKDIIANLTTDLKLCKGVTNKAELKITNRGTKIQTVKLSSETDWVRFVNRKITLEPNDTKNIEIDLEVPEDANEKIIKIKYSYGEETKEINANVNYNNKNDCFGVELKTKEDKFDAERCIGKTQELYVKNIGLFPINVSIKSDINWLYFENDNIQLQPKEEKVVFFLIVPPLEVKKGIHEINIIAETNYETMYVKPITLEIFGASFGKEPLDINLHSIDINRLIEELDVDVELTFKILNDSDRAIKINDINSDDYNSIIIPKKTVLDVNEETEVNAYIDLPEGYDKNFVVMTIRIKTDEGTIDKTIKFEIKKEQIIEEEPQEVTKEEPVKVTPGLITLQSVTTIGAILVVFILTLLIIYALFSRNKEQKENNKKIKK